MLYFSMQILLVPTHFVGNGMFKRNIAANAKIQGRKMIGRSRIAL